MLFRKTTFAVLLACLLFHLPASLLARSLQEAPGSQGAASAKAESKDAKESDTETSDSAAKTSDVLPVKVSGVAPPAPQSPFANIDNAPVQNANIDLSVPESPAFTVLDLTPQTIIRPASPRELATSILNGVDRNGNFQTGIALDTTPYLLFAGRELTLAKYRESRAAQFLAHTVVSFATTKGASEEDKSVRMAIGLHFAIFDKGDPRLDRELSACFKRVDPRFEPISPTADDATVKLEVARRTAILQTAGDPCRAEARKRNWNRSSWIVGLAPSWISPTGETGNLKWNGGGVWTSLAYGFEGVPALERTSQLIFHARYRDSEQVPDPDMEGAIIKQNSVYLGGRFRVGAPEFNANFEALYLRNKPAGRDPNSSYRVSVGAERKINKDLWFVISAGGEGGRADGKNKGFVLTSFKWAFSKAPTIQAPAR